MRFWRTAATLLPRALRLANGETHAIAGLGGWPRALDVDSHIARHQGDIPLGVRRTVVPAAPDAFVQVLRRWVTGPRPIFTRSLKRSN